MARWTPIITCLLFWPITCAFGQDSVPGPMFPSTLAEVLATSKDSVDSFHPERYISPAQKSNKSAAARRNQPSQSAFSRRSAGPGRILQASVRANKEPWVTPKSSEILNMFPRTAVDGKQVDPLANSEPAAPRVSQPNWSLPSSKLNPANGLPVKPSTAAIGALSSSEAKPKSSVEEDASPVASPDAILSTTIIGPQVMLENTPEQFEIVIANSSKQLASGIIVQLSVPDTLTISKVDRNAFLDAEARTVSWEIAEIRSGSQESIYYGAFSASPGTLQQQIVVGMNNSFQCRTPFKIEIKNEKDYQQYTHSLSGMIESTVPRTPKTPNE